MITLSQTRGDTRGYYFKRIDGDGQVITTAPNSLYFTVKSSFFTQQVVFQKKLEDMTVDEDGTYHFVIEPKDTESLDYGSYVWDIQVTQDNVVTTIAKGTLNLTHEATWASNEGE